MRCARRCLAALLALALCPMAAWSASASKGWREALDARTARIWVDAQVLDGLVLNARARVDVTWLPRSLLKRLEKDQRTDAWALDGLHLYYSKDKETAAKMKGRDVVVVNYRTEKSWTFDPTELAFGGRSIGSEDILGSPASWPVGELPSGATGTLFLAVPSPEPGVTVRVTLGPDSADIALPKR